MVRSTPVRAGTQPSRVKRTDSNEKAVGATESTRSVQVTGPMDAYEACVPADEINTQASRPRVSADVNKRRRCRSQPIRLSMRLAAPKRPKLD
jgi:hypothetical protein